MQKNYKNRLSSNGQVMILSVLAIGGILLVATTVAGFLISYGIRQSGDFTASTRAIIAADAGVEWELYIYTHPTSTEPSPSFGNGSKVTVQCFDDNDKTLECAGPKATSTVTVLSNGEFRDASRIFEIRGIGPFVQQ